MCVCALEATGNKAGSWAPVPEGSSRDIQKCENLLFACQMSSLQKVIQLCIKLFLVVYKVSLCKEDRVAFKTK